MYPVQGPCVAVLAAPGFHRGDSFRAAPSSCPSCQTLDPAATVLINRSETVVAPTPPIAKAHLTKAAQGHLQGLSDRGKRLAERVERNELTLVGLLHAAILGLRDPGRGREDVGLCVANCCIPDDHKVVDGTVRGLRGASLS